MKFNTWCDRVESLAIEASGLSLDDIGIGRRELRQSWEEGLEPREFVELYVTGFGDRDPQYILDDSFDPRWEL